MKRGGEYLNIFEYLLVFETLINLFIYNILLNKSILIMIAIYLFMLACAR